MNCTEARDALLVVELGELRRADMSSPLAAHLAACAGCRARATSIVNQTANVGSLIAGRSSGARRARSGRRFAIIASLPIAAALFVVATTKMREVPTAAPRAVDPSRPVVRNVSVDVVRGQQTTVLKTADSTVTVIWLTPGVGQ